MRRDRGLLGQNSHCPGFLCSVACEGFIGTPCKSNTRRQQPSVSCQEEPADCAGENADPAALTYKSMALQQPQSGDRERILTIPHRHGVTGPDAALLFPWRPDDEPDKRFGTQRGRPHERSRLTSPVADTQSNRGCSFLIGPHPTDHPKCIARILQHLARSSRQLCQPCRRGPRRKWSCRS